MIKSRLRSILVLIVCAVITLSLVPIRAWSWEIDPIVHTELRGSVSQICGLCRIFKGERLTTSPKAGVQLYVDYLPLKHAMSVGEFHFGPYASISAIGKVEKIAGGLAATFRPQDSSWEFFTQTGIRYTSDKMRYISTEGEHGSQDRGAFNLAFGSRKYFADAWYLSILYEHDSNGRKIGLKIFPNNDGFNPGVDSLMFGVGRTF